MIGFYRFPLWFSGLNTLFNARPGQVVCQAANQPAFPCLVLVVLTDADLYHAGRSQPPSQLRNIHE